MSNAAKLKGLAPIRLLNSGEPGAGKTSALVALANAGFKLRILDYDGNFRPVLNYVDERVLPNIDIQTLQEELKFSPTNGLEPKGKPKAFTRGLQLMTRWKYTEKDGTEVDLGDPAEWGPDTVVVLDTISSQGDTAMWQALNMVGRSPLNRRDKDWGLAIDLQANFLNLIRHVNNQFHFIANAHIRVISPDTERDQDTALQRDVKEQRAELMPTKAFPHVLGRQLPRTVTGKFEGAVTTKKAERGPMKGKRVITWDDDPNFQTKLAASTRLSKELDVGTGLLQIFEELVPGAVELARKNLQ